MLRNILKKKKMNFKQFNKIINTFLLLITVRNDFRSVMCFTNAFKQ